MTSSVETYTSLVSKAYEGRLQLPAFQRNWKWKTSQVILLFDSLRQGFPIGNFLFIKRSDEFDLSPRDFRSSSKGASKTQPENLVLDGQQRITAGLELFYERGSTNYFIDLERLFKMVKDMKVDLSSTPSIRAFLADLDADDRYCIAKRASSDPSQNLLKRHLLWTATLNDEIELKRALKLYIAKYPERSDFVEYVVEGNFKPSAETTIPVTTIDGGVSIEAVSRIFSTLNSTGKLLTPFELVVSILFPHQLNLADDIETLRDLHPYYGRIDETGDILLQTVALFGDKGTKKAALPKTITAELYRQHHMDAADYLNKAGKLLTDKIGLGLDSSSELLVYPVIFSPMAYALKLLDGEDLSQEDRAKAERKIAKWFIGAVLSRRYQQSTHDKQLRDKTEIYRWIKGGDDEMPQWLKDTYIENLKVRAPDSATGKLLRCIMNARGLKDPHTLKPVGIKSGAATTAKHHIFPTRFVKSLVGWNDEDTANLALNVMMIEQSTNASWLHLDPAIQLSNAIQINGRATTVEILQAHGISEACIAIMEKPLKSRKDFYDFLQERENFFVAQLENWGFRRALQPEVDIEDEPIED
ncbi:MAG: DUF262 domain-containing protein [Mesorhizobium sp.]|uniref:GmrSD restriction endonuclease domain-containing protein n=1 Tax=Mesorhizobium sp. M7A.F.Ca.ET.027.02.1.1 TaxID=2496655 RepID=UPI000FD54B22|nr:DUF262 domain-containing protein [Mesorhizobium sp. M7A.F.Ca.ET.027.02.1.1]RVD12179.1 DUF262 domain-containing protein [Mesorhizobium sp. M7A.F.Ca.ET.027.02.1.1]RWD08222.1 MAG: DUF262 domain-containing protein [Mesorhizobium sp.]